MTCQTRHLPLVSHSSVSQACWNHQESKTCDGCCLNAFGDRAARGSCLQLPGRIPGEGSCWVEACRFHTAKGQRAGVEARQSSHYSRVSTEFSERLPWLSWLGMSCPYLSSCKHVQKASASWLYLPSWMNSMLVLIFFSLSKLLL